MPQDRDYKIRNIVRAVLGDVWLILPDKMEEIAALLEARAAGQIPSEDDLRVRFGPKIQEFELDLGAVEEDEGPQIVDGVQVIDVEGTLSPRVNLLAKFSGGTSTQLLARDLRNAADNPDVRSVILRVDSPGGAASYTPEAAEAVRKLASRKRVVTSATNVMASGAYWIGAAASAVYASPSTQVGSIGVYTILQNVKKRAEDQGIKFAVFRAGELKAAGNPYEDLTEGRRASIQKQVDDIYANFVGDIARYRKVSVERVANDFGQGSTFLAPEAATLGMIDGVATFEEVFGRERSGNVPVVSLGRAELTASARGNEMEKRVLAALFAKGLVPSMDVSDELATVALSTARNLLSIPEDASIDTLVSTISGPAKMTVTTVEPKEPKPEVTNTLVSTSDRTSAAVDERMRINEIRSRGRLIGATDEQIQTAIDSGISIKDAVFGWSEKLTKQEPPVVPISPGAAEADKLCGAASALLCQRTGLALDEDEQRAVTQFGGSLKNRKLIDICRKVMETTTGYRTSYDDLTDARAFLSQPGELFVAGGGSANRRGDHPDLMSSLTSKALNDSARYANTTYDQWCQRIADLPDFKPRSFIDIGVFGDLDAITEDEAPKQMKIPSEMQNWIKADRYAGEVGMTVEMLIDDDLDGFIGRVRQLGVSARNTLQAVILNQFNANPVMLDGNAFFSVAHNNLASGGGAPGDTQYAAHRLLHRLQTSYGTNQPMGMTFSRVLVPAAHETAAIASLVPNFEVKTPNTDATVNTFRGLATPIVEARLDAYSANILYSLLEPGLTAAVVYSFQRGYGETGRQEERYDDRRKTRYFMIESRFGVAMANWRAMVMNDGVA